MIGGNQNAPVPSAPAEPEHLFHGAAMAYEKGVQNYSKEISRRGASVLKAVDPHDGGHWDVLITHDKMDWISKKGNGASLELADTVRWSLLNPRSLRRGVRDLDREISEDNWLCYCATPRHAYDHKTGEKRPPWEGEVFLVYVTEDRFVYLWYWDKCDNLVSHLPRDFESRFIEQIF
jgi:hypothetical protein